jgi:DNA polymerase-3 subunit alpha
MGREEKDRLVKARAFESCRHTHPILVQRELAQRRRRARQAVGNGRPMRFVSLHHHSTFSYLDGYALPGAHVRRAEELNMAALALTEHGNIASHVKLEEAASRTGVKPIFGCEVYTGYTDERRTQMKNHLTVLAKDAEGYGNLMRMISDSYARGFYYEPTVDWRMLRRYHRGLAVLSGCQSSELFTALVGGKHVDPGDASYKRARGVARRFQRLLGQNYLIEVQAFPELERTRQANPLLARLAGELGIPLVATMDCHYTVYTERELQVILHNVRPGNKQTVEEQVRDWGYDVPLCPPPNDRSIYRRLRATGLTKAQALEAVYNTESLAQDCNVTLPKLPMVRFPLPPGETDRHRYWRKMIKRGWEYRRCDDLPAKERRRYQDQLDKELEVMEGKDFTDYFLVVADSVQWAKDNQIAVGPARGSAAASIVCWLLRITEVNPMLFPDLVFERFIDVSREDLPDIDLDFDSDRRHEVRDYLVSKYGEGHVNNIGTFAYYKSKLALDDVARVFRIPEYEVKTIKDLLLERSSGDLRASATIEDTVGQFEEAGEVLTRYPDITKAMDLEGNVKQFGVHAAGLVVSNGPITDVTAVLQRTVNGHDIEVVSMDKYDAERQGLLKLDYLGLSTMAMLAEACRQLNMKVEDLYAIPLEDEVTVQGFRENDVVGVFQFEGRATRSVCGSLQPDSFKEVCDVNALSRPGPLHNGAANAYIDIKRGTRKPELIHPLLDSITAGTNFQIVYQEQILRIVREVGGFDWTAAAYIRRIMSKKHGEAEFNRQWERFWAGAQERGLDEKTAKKIWGLCITAGAYAFNAAHSTSYGMIAWWTMWFKRHHPAVFYAAALSKMPDMTSGRGSAGVSMGRHAMLRRDAALRGIRILAPHPKRSGLTWAPAKRGSLRAGLTQIPGVGEKSGQAMLDFREASGGVDGWNDYLHVKGIGPKTVLAMQEFSEAEDPFEIFALDRKLETAKEFIKKAGLMKPTHTSQQIPYESGRDTEITWVGVGVHLNLRDIFESNRARTGVELKPEEIKRPDLNEFMMVAGYDGTELVNLRFNRFIYPRFRNQIWNIKLGHDVLLIHGTKPGFRTAREVYVDKMIVIDPEED